MREEHIAVQRTARYHTIGSDAAAELWIVCHGYAQLARYFLRAFTPLDDGTRLIVAPEALNRYYFDTAPGVHAHDARIGATWMTREDRDVDIADYIAYLDTLHATLTRDVTRSTIVALGFSQGAATISRWAVHGSGNLHHVVLWGSGLAHELQPAPSLLRGAELTVCVGDDDAYATRGTAAAEQARLTEAGMSHGLLRYAGGHRVDTDALQQLARRVRKRA